MNSKIVILSLLLLSSTVAISQNQLKIDSLKNKLSLSKGAEEVDIMNQLGMQYTRSNFQQANEYATGAIRKAVEIDYCKGHAKALFVQANAFFFNNDHKKCIELCLVSADKAIECKEWQLACDDYEAIAAINISLWQDYPKSLEYYLKSLQIYEQYY